MNTNILINPDCVNDLVSISKFQIKWISDVPNKLTTTKKVHNIFKADCIIML